MRHLALGTVLLIAPAFGQAPCPDETAAPSQGIGDPDSALLAALQEQLGIKLEARKVPLDVIVVDRAEKASEN